MTPRTKHFLRCTALVVLPAVVFAQEQPSGGWRRLGDQAPAASSANDSQAPGPYNEAPPPPDNQVQGPYNQAPGPYNQAPGPYNQAPSGAYNQGPRPYNQAPPPQYNPGPVPADLTIRPGTYLTVRIDQMLSSDRSHQGDAFTATLVKPLVVDGVVVAQAGQTLGGRVMETQRAGRVEGVSRLGVELIDMSLVDGQQIPLKTSFVTRVGGNSIGRDAAAIGTTTAIGAAAGAAADNGFGAGIGAAAGAAVGIVGVLVTRGHATVIYPESVMTFRIEAPINISTARAPQAFRYVEPQEYQRADFARPRYEQVQPVRPAPYYGPVWGGYGYPYPYYGPGFYGPSFSFFYGRGYYGRPYYYRGGRRW